MGYGSQESRSRRASPDRRGKPPRGLLLGSTVLRETYNHFPSSEAKWNVAEIKSYVFSLKTPVVHGIM